MPAYGTVTGSAVPVLTTGQSVEVVDAELMTGVYEGERVCLPPNDQFPRSYAVEYFFTESDGVTPANPGAFEFDLQHADIDTDTHYVSVLAISTGLNASYVGRAELVDVVAKYSRPRLGSIANSGVYLTVLYTR